MHCAIMTDVTGMFLGDLHILDMQIQVNCLKAQGQIGRGTD